MEIVIAIVSVVLVILGGSFKMLKYLADIARNTGVMVEKLKHVEESGHRRETRIDKHGEALDDHEKRISHLEGAHEKNHKGK